LINLRKTNPSIFNSIF